jgi:hypothetical protein
MNNKHAEHPFSKLKKKWEFDRWEMIIQRRNQSEEEQKLKLILLMEIDRSFYNHISQDFTPMKNYISWSS